MNKRIQIYITKCKTNRVILAYVHTTNPTNTSPSFEERLNKVKIIADRINKFNAYKKHKIRRVYKFS